MNTSSAAQAAQALLDRGEAAQAIAVAQRAVASGDGDAAFLVAIWHLVGQPLPRDVPRARDHLRRAAPTNPDAALMEVALTANGSGAAPDWPRARSLLEVAARHDTVAAGQLALVDAMDLAPDGSPRSLPPVEMLSQAPYVAVHRAAFSPAECAHLAQSIADIIAPSVVVDPATGRHVHNPIRDSDDAVIGPTRETLVVAAINRRLAAMTGTRFDQGESLQVLRYAPGQQYRLHSDALPGNGAQRIATAIIYLNDGFGGGETEFPSPGVVVTPRAGDTLVFHNTLADGRMDPAARHAGLPVRQGVKWIATRWIRAAAYDPWQAGGGG